MNNTFPSKPLTRALPLALTLLPIAAPLPAMDLEEVMVTAQKREQSTQDIGITINAFSGSMLEDMGLRDSKEIAEKIPNVNIHSPTGEGGVAVVFVRGVGLNDFATNNIGPVGVYVDEVFAGSSNSQVVSLLDIERVEVLKGPQGTLFGRNTTGGAINIVSRKPTAEFEGYLRASYGDYSGGNDEYKLEGVVSGPLGDTVGGRLAISQYQSDGYMQNLATGDYVEKDIFAARALLDWSPNERWYVLLNLHTSDNDSDADLYHSSLDKDFFEGVSDIAPVLEVEQNGASVRLEYDISDSVQLVSLSAYDELDKFHTEDADMTGFTFIHTNYGVEQETFSQELRLVGNAERAHWIAGLYFLSDELIQDQGVDLRDVGLPIPARYHNEQDTDTWALFGQVEYDLNESLVLTAGLRHTGLQMDYSSTGESTFFIGPEGEFVQRYALTDKLEDDAFSGKLGLNWHASEHTLWYGTISRGFKGAGFNGNFHLDLSAPLDYDPETLLAYEVGVKTSLADGAAQINAAVFYYDYQDAQIFNSDPVPGIGLPANTIRNADLSSQGFDLDITWAPLPGLFTRLGLGYLDSRYDEDVLDPTTGLLPIQGNRVQNSPEWSAFALANYEWRLGDVGTLSLQADVTYSDDVYYSTREDIVIGQKAYSLVNGRLAYCNTSESLELSLWGRNLTDKEYGNYAFDLRADFGFVEYMRGQPRTVGVDVTFFF